MQVWLFAAFAPNDSALPLCSVKQTKAKLIQMIIQLKMLILEAKARKKSHKEEATYRIKKSYAEGIYNGKEQECDFFIDKLTALLLDAETQSTVKKPEA